MWFTEDPWPPVLILAVMAVVFGIAWNATRRGRYFLIAAGAVLAGLGVLVVEEMIVTEAEVVEARVYALAEAVTQGDSEQVVDFISAEAGHLRDEIGSRMQDIEVQDSLRITDLQVTLPSEVQALSHFRANGSVTWKKSFTHTGPTRWNLTWQNEAGTWRVIQVDRLDPITGEIMGTWSHL